MQHRTEALVLSSRPFGEADLIVSFFTLRFGRVDLFVKSPRKLKSRFGGSLEPLTHSNIDFWGKEDANLPRLTQSDIIRPFQGIRDEFGTFLKASEMAELLLRFLPEREPNQGVFSLVLDVLDKVESGLKNPPRAGKGRSAAPGGEKMPLLYFKVKFLQLTGHAPRLASCARCPEGSVTPDNKGSVTPDKREAMPPDIKGSVTPDKKGSVTPVIFYASQGSVLCNKCSGGMKGGGGRQAIELSAGSVRLYETLGDWEPASLGRLGAAPGLIDELNGVLDAQIEYTLAAPIKSRSFLEDKVVKGD